MTPDPPTSAVSPGPDADITGLAKRGLLSLAGAAVSAVASLLVIVVVTRGAGQVTAGYLFSATSLFVILESLCALGTATGAVYYIARLRALDQHRAVRSLVRTALRPVSVVTVTMAVALFLLAPQLAEAMGSSGRSTEQVTLIRLLAVFLPFAVVYDLFIAATQGFHTMTPTVALEKVGRPIAQVALLGVAVAIGAMWSLSIAWAAPYVVGLVLVGLSLRRLISRDESNLGGESAPIEWRSFWRYTAPRGIASAAQLSLQRLDIVLVAIYLGAAAAAIYTAATRFVVLGQLGSQAVALAVQPKLAELIARRDLTVTQHVYRTSTAWVIAVTWPIHLLVGMLAPIILQMFGTGYGSGQWVVVILAGSMLVATSCGMVTMLLVMAGKTAANLFNVLVALAANLTLNVILIPRWGIVGAAVAWAVAIILGNLLPLVQVHRSLGVNPFGRGSVAVSLLALFCFAFLPAIGWATGGHSAIVIALSAVGLIAYVGGLWVLRSMLEIDALVASISRRFRPATSR